MISPPELPDPRRWPPASGRAPWPDVQAALDAATRDVADARDANARAWLRQRLEAGESEVLAHTLAEAPSYAHARHLRRLVADVERTYVPDDALRTTLFAIPLVVVVALEAGRAPVALDGILPDSDAIAKPLRAARAFAGCETFALAPSLVEAPTIAIDALPALLARGRVAHADAARFAPPLDLPPAPVRVDSPDERVHLRFVVGAILTPPRIDPLARATLGREGVALARALVDAAKAPGVSLLVLPGPPQRLSLAIGSGRAAQREVSAQLFASNAIRRLRMSHGEPTAIIAAHRAADAAGGGELRLSLSSPFAPEAAEGFRCPLDAVDSVHDVAAMLDALLRDCRVTDIRMLAGVHDDVDPVTRRRLFVKDGGADSSRH